MQETTSPIADLGEFAANQAAIARRERTEEIQRRNSHVRDRKELREIAEQNAIIGALATARNEVRRG